MLRALEAGGDNFAPLYEPEATLTEKIETVAREIYGADGVDYAAGVERRLRRMDRGVARGFPVCMAKTQYSLSDNAALLGSAATVSASRCATCGCQRPERGSWCR